MTASKIGFSASNFLDVLVSRLMFSLKYCGLPGVFGSYFFAEVLVNELPFELLSSDLWWKFLSWWFYFATLKMDFSCWYLKRVCRRWSTVFCGSCVFPSPSMLDFFTT